MAAAAYFRGIVNGLVTEMLDGLAPQRFHITGIQASELHLRSWSSVVIDQERLHELLELLMDLRSEVRELQEGRVARQDVVALAAGWLSEHLNGADIYVEVSVRNTEIHQEEQPEFTMAMIRGRCAMMSTDQCMFTWLDRDMFGLALAGQGSYLLEVVPDEKAGRTYRKAS